MIFSAIAAGIGAVVEGIGAGAAALGSVAASQTAVTAAGVGASLIGTGVQMYGQSKAADAEKRREQVAREQMHENVARQERETFRRQMIAQALSKQRAVSQGIDFGSSVVPGAIAQATGSASQEVEYGRTNLALGERAFNANADRSAALGIAGLGAGVKSFGSDLLKPGVAESIAKVGNYWAGTGGDKGIA